MDYYKKYLKYKYKYKYTKLKNLQNGGNINNLSKLKTLLNFEPNFTTKYNNINNINILHNKTNINFTENSFTSTETNLVISSLSENDKQVNKVFIKPKAEYIKGTFTPDYFENPLSDHGAIKYDTTLIWNITQKGYEMNNIPNVYTHKFMNLKNETDYQYDKRCESISNKISEIVTKFPEIDVILLQELPNSLYGDVFYNRMKKEINNKSYILLCNYYKTKWPTGILFESTKYFGKYLHIPSGLDNPEYKRMSIFLLTEFVTKNNKIYVSVHATYKDEKTRGQELINLMDNLVKKLVTTLPYNISSVTFGGDFNAPFKNDIISIYTPVIYTIPGTTVYSASDNYGKRNSKQIDFIIIYKLF
jgi:hypothetical protein